MKNYQILLTTAIVFLGFQLQGQITYGVNAGIGTSNMHFTEGASGLALNTQPVFSYQLGAFANIPLDYGIFFHPEVSYAHRGSRVFEGTSFDILGIPINAGVGAEAAINYLDIPLLLKYKFMVGKMQAYALGGPKVTYAMNGNLTTTAQVLFDVTLSETPLDFSSGNGGRMGVAGDIGAGVEVPFGTGALSFDGRYSHGFSSEINLPVVDLNLKSRGLSFNVGYSFAF